MGFRYFGYGSNMDRLSLAAKGVVPVRSLPARLAGWRLRFNVGHFFAHEGGVANIEPAGADEAVLGLLHWLEDDHLPLLDAAEACPQGYDRITVPIATAEGQTDAVAYVGTPGFIDETCLPTRRYLNILVRGARAAGLDPAYVAALAAHAVHVPQPAPPFAPPPGDWPLLGPADLAAQPGFTALAGHAFDLRPARAKHDFLRGLFGGRDMTLFHLKRMDASDGSESEADIAAGRFSAAQRAYLDMYLQAYTEEYRYIGQYDPLTGGEDV